MKTVWYLINTILTMLTTVSRTCIIDRRSKKQHSGEVKYADMKIVDNTVSFVPLDARVFNTSENCEYVAKLYTTVNPNITFTDDTQCITAEFVMWDNELQAGPPAPLDQTPLFAIGAFACDANGDVNYSNPGSVYMSNTGVYFRGKDDGIFGIPETALFNTDTDFASISDTNSRNMQTSVERKDGRLHFYIKGALICKVFAPRNKYKLALMTGDRRLCSMVLRADKGKVQSHGNLWKISELSEHKRAHYRDRDGSPYTHGAETTTNDVYGAHYEHTIHEAFQKYAGKNQRSWIVPKLRGLFSDGSGVVMITQYCRGKTPRNVVYDETWKVAGLIADAMACGNMMWQTRIVHEDFFLRNFIISIDENDKTTRGTMIDFDRMRCMHNSTEEALSRWIVCILLAFFMELAYIIFNVGAEVNPCVAHTILRVINILSSDKPVYIFRGAKIVPNWNFWRVWYEGDHECNDRYYFENLHGTNLKFAARDTKESNLVGYPSAMKTILNFISYQVYCEEISCSEL